MMGWMIYFPFCKEDFNNARRGLEADRSWCWRYKYSRSSDSGFVDAALLRMIVLE